MRKWEFGKWKAEVGIWKWEFGRWKAEVGIWKWEIGMRKWELKGSFYFD
jgi:hypothetical protein